ncbi:MAG: hypothetical protein J7L23_05250 [Candidatus Diapherotrites archaeon]|nr:hypothetical protein [Candidatus Diapherotrites archaeon]
MSWTYKPRENPDWAYARNLQTVLKNINGTWSQSVYSVNLNGFLAPNRDYPHQGLTAMMDGENWKFLDAIFLRDENSKLKPDKVVVNPWKVVYKYSSRDAKLSVGYYIFSDKREGLSAKVEFKSTKPIDLKVKPLVDIRPINSQSMHHKTKLKGNTAIATNSGKSIAMRFNGEASLLMEPISWWYKLGSGFREETPSGIRFTGETREPMFPVEFTSYGKKFSLLLACDKTKLVEKRLKRTLKMREPKSRLPNAPTTLRDSKLTDALRARLYCMKGFDTMVNGVKMPAAGDYWFKKVYFRDVFEGLYNNIHVLIKTRGKSYIRDILKLALSLQDKKTGRIPNTYPNDYNSCDATTLCFMVVGEYLKETKDRSLARTALKHLNLAVKSFSKTKPALNGPPVIREDKLLSCVPWHSWTDVRTTVNVSGEEIPLIPKRIPPDWLEIFQRDKKDIYKECNSPRYLLPEINAQWVKMLEAGVYMSKLAGGKSPGIYEEASSSFIKNFWTNDFIPNIIATDGKTDTTPTSMGLVASVISTDLLGLSRLKRMEKQLKKLLVYRNGKLFGMLVKDSKEKVYLNDSQYQEAVIWPRDTPYLVKYMLLVGKKKAAQELLENQLEHQMEEGAIFYNHELFSLPEGTNSLKGGTKNPVPVKNPIQYWSQFVEPFILAFQ